MELSESLVRPYQPSDKPAVYQIAADTAFFGQPVERYMDDRKLFCDGFYRYYTDLEPESSWVACIGGKVAGFLMGCLDTRIRDRTWITGILPSLTWNFFCGRYLIWPKTARYIWRLFLTQLRGENVSVDLKQYPAHLHINVREECRGFGLGRQLLEAYLKQLHWVGCPGVHLHTTNMNITACRLYEKQGFELLSVHLTSLWAGLVEKPVELRLYGLSPV